MVLHVYQYIAICANCDTCMSRNLQALYLISSFLVQRLTNSRHSPYVSFCFTVLAVGYNTGHVILCHIENSEVLHSIQVGKEVTCLAWVCQSLAGKKPWSCDPYLEDSTETYLPKLQPLNKR